MKNILIIGSTGQIGSELTMKLRTERQGTVVAGYINGAEPKGELKESGPSAIVDITNAQQIAEVVDQYKIDTIYNLAALLSAVAEAKPLLAWKIGVDGLFNVLEVAREKNVPCLPQVLLVLSDLTLLRHILRKTLCSVHVLCTVLPK